MKTILNTILIITGILIAIIVIFFIYATLADYKPKEKITVFVDTDTPTIKIDTINIMTWNIGYCGMDKTIDFFYDGGTMTRVSKKQTIENINKIVNYIKRQSVTNDFIFLQEIDKKAKRSYNTNQFDSIKKALPDFKAFFGKNYDVPFIPVPIKAPYGHVVAGIGIFSRYTPTKVVRYQYPGNFSWPKRLFMLDRCFLVARYKLKNNKQLLLINLHNSAFDNGNLRKQQIEYLKKFAVNEYKKGNYIIIGGDWNQRPPYFKPNYKNFIFTNKRSPKISPDIFPNNWSFVYQTTIPTNRNADKVWDKETVPVTTIDFFLVSPNVKPIEIKAQDLGFENTDHNPVFGKFIIQ
jgi:endonuclease/exonuclease/phosphatase family metal-dependent hydrolase